MKKLKMKPNQTDGYLITFCGLDGCGKTTMLNRLITEVSGFDIFLTKQPTDFVRYTGIFRTYMDNPDHSAYDYRSLALLAASDRLQHGSKVIEPEMNKGKIVLSDRYFYSCLANLRARGYKDDKWIYEIAESVMKPDIAFFFDIPVEEAISRVRSRPLERDRYIDTELQHKLRKEYLKICKASGGVLVPTNISEDESFSIVKKAVLEVIKNEHI